MEQAHADFIGISVQELRDEFEEAQRYEDELEKELFDDISLESNDNKQTKTKPSVKDEFPFQDDLFADDFVQFEDNKEDNIFDDSFIKEDSPSLMSEQWIRNLFRRTAKELHPNKELAPKRKLIKQAKMAELLDARKNSDIMSMLMIYSEYVNSDDISFAENEIKTICQLLEKQLNQLKEDKITYLYAHPHREAMHDLIYNPSQKKQQLNFVEMNAIEQKLILIQYWMIFLTLMTFSFLQINLI